jgi:hypothetical protein
VFLTLRPGAKISGRVAFDIAELSGPPDMSKVVLELRALSDRTAAFRRGQPATFRAAVHATGEFAFSGVAPGLYRLLGSLAGSASWVLSAASTASTEVLDTGIAVDEDVNDLVVRFANESTQIAGRLDGPTGVPATEYFILAFPMDRRFWAEPWRRVAHDRPALDGSFAINGLPPGAYGLAVLTDLEDRDWVMAGFLDSLVPVAVPITLTDGLRLTQNLRIRLP